MRGSEDPGLLNPAIDFLDAFDTQDEDVPCGILSFTASLPFPSAGEVRKGKMGDFPMCSIGGGPSPSTLLQPTGGGTGPGGIRVQ